MRPAIAAAVGRPRDPRRLVADVADMRRRVAAQHPRPTPWDLRNRRGGLVDIEFLVQYLILRTAPGIAPSGIAAAIDALGEAGALPPRGAQDLGAAVRLLRHVQTLLALMFEGVPEPNALDGLHGATLARCVGAVDFARLEAELCEACARGREWYDRPWSARPARRATQPASGTNSDRRSAPMTLNVGDKAPDFTIPADGGGTVSLSGLKGKPVVLYFYPKGRHLGLHRRGLRVPRFAARLQCDRCHRDRCIEGFGRLARPVQKKYELPFFLGADTTGEVPARNTARLDRKSMYGRKYMGIERATFLIDKGGVIRGIWHKVKVGGHVAEVLKAAKAL